MLLRKLGCEIGGRHGHLSKPLFQIAQSDMVQKVDIAYSCENFIELEEAEEFLEVDFNGLLSIYLVEGNRELGKLAFRQGQRGFERGVPDSDLLGTQIPLEKNVVIQETPGKFHEFNVLAKV